MRRAIMAGAVISLALGGPVRAQQAWLGFTTQPADSLPEVGKLTTGFPALRAARVGLEVTTVFPHSPAEEGGLLRGDIVIALAGKPFTCPAESMQIVLRREISSRAPGEVLTLALIRAAQRRELRLNSAAPEAAIAERFWTAPGELLDSLPSPARIEARVEKQRVILQLPVVLGLRPEERWPPPRENESIFPPALFPEGVLGRAFRELGSAYGFTGDNEDLLARLARCHVGRDPYRLDCILYVHRDPFRLETVARHIAASLGASRQGRDAVLRGAALLTPQHALSIPAARRLVLATAGDGGGDGAEAAPPPGAQLSGAGLAALADVIAQVMGTLAEARTWHARAFASLNEEERGFLAARCWGLTEAFASEIYLHLDENGARLRDNLRVIELAARVNQAALHEAAVRIALLCDPAWAQAAGARIRSALGDSIEAEILLDYSSPYGRLLVGGTAGHWYRDLDAAFILDLGGDDFYTGSCGGSQGWSLPFSVAIDLAGNDAYESTLPACQGSGCLGVGGLLDLEGDDQYIAIHGCQGLGYFGVGWLHDCAGNDVYRGRSFCQGVGLFGLGILLDSSGSDRYEADSHSQGVGLPGGVGALIDHAGDDQYYAKGLYPSGYGDAGIFDGWSQGCGVGFRSLASGGLGLLLDGGGRDRMEAGNFSQGGGYYYGCGVLQALGEDSDVYIGSRYNQGFCAHQAAGVFLEEGGDDRYTTRQGVAQGLAWDESVTLFVDAAGDDVYEGGGFFSQGAAAHNSVCFFLDRAGRDTYRYSPGPAHAKENDYHGGTSFALFVDEGGASDSYVSARAGNDTLRYELGHGVILDLPGRLEEALSGLPAGE